MIILGVCGLLVVYVYVYVGVCGCMWVYVGVCGCMWVYVGVCGCMWVYVGVCGCMWVYVGVCGKKKESIVLFPNFRVTDGFSILLLLHDKLHQIN